MSRPSKTLKGIPVTDNHVHFRPDGQMEPAISGFLHMGGVRVVVVHSPYEDLLAHKVGSFEPGYQRTLRLAEKARGHGVDAHVALGPYPVELLSLEEAVGLEEAIKVMRRGLEDAARHVEEGNAIAIGEIGRPHFPVAERLWDASNELLAYGMALAKDVDCSVILHTEEATRDVYGDLARLAASSGLPGDRVVKHHSGPLVLPEENHGLFPSVVAKGDWVREAAMKGRRFLMETDYLDDPERPGAVLGLNTVPRRSARLLEEGVFSREDLMVIHRDNFRTVYGV